ncbi:uncharacterized protein RJT21DRAFT_496 [Scheffersomyces amazonensis]|uniref:uncharacterized protein n=1 Tax=Scheffersomyces amazonensis TaxID=1078765 RepID=UPI00315CE9A2
MSIESTQIIVANAPVTAVNFEWNKPDSTFEITKTTINPEDLKDGEVLVRTIYFSNDPFTRSTIQKVENQQYPKGAPVIAVGLGEVLKSKSTKYKQGDIITGVWSWSEYAIVNEHIIYFAIDPNSKYPLTYYLTLLGIGPLTAYFGLVKQFNFKLEKDSDNFTKKNLIIISAASGAVGSAAVQLSKHLFGISTVVGITGSDEKAQWVESIGADKAFNYKSKTFQTDLAEYVSANGRADYYFDNVGGEILSFILSLLNPYGKVAACGSIAGYNDPSKSLVSNWYKITTSRLQILGFTVHDYVPEYLEALKVLEQAIDEKKLVTENAFGIEDISDKANKYELVPLIWSKIFTEEKSNGKLITKFSN